MNAQIIACFERFTSVFEVIVMRLNLRVTKALYFIVSIKKSNTRVGKMPCNLAAIFAGSPV